MKDGPILFSGEMVKAILNGRKTQTRRVIKPQPDSRHCRLDFENGELKESSMLGGCWHVSKKHKCPHGKPGDLLWVRETMFVDGCLDLYYKADNSVVWSDPPEDYFYREPEYVGSIPSIFMPRWASRLTLKILNIKAERLQDVSEEDAKAEGVKVTQALKILSGFYPGDTHKIEFKNLWDSINAKPKPHYKKIDGKRTIIYYESFPWEEIRETRSHRGKPWYVIGNPWVWAIGFSPIKKNVDEVIKKETQSGTQ